MTGDWTAEQLVVSVVAGVFVLGVVVVLGLGLCRAAARPAPKPDDLFAVAEITDGVDHRPCRHTEQRATGTWSCASPVHPETPDRHYLQRSTS